MIAVGRRIFKVFNSNGKLLAIVDNTTMLLNILATLKVVECFKANNINTIICISRDGILLKISKDNVSEISLYI